MKEFKFKDEEEARDEIAKVFYKYQIEEEELYLIMDACQHISKSRLKATIEKNIADNPNWKPTSEWILELCK